MLSPYSHMVPPFPGFDYDSHPPFSVFNVPSFQDLGPPLSHPPSVSEFIFPLFQCSTPTYLSRFILTPSWVWYTLHPGFEIPFLPGFFYYRTHCVMNQQNKLTYNTYEYILLYTNTNLPFSIFCFSFPHSSFHRVLSTGPLFSGSFPQVLSTVYGSACCFS